MSACFQAGADRPTHFLCLWIWLGRTWPLQMGPTGCSETLVTNYHSALCDNPEERRSNESAHVSQRCTQQHRHSAGVNTVPWTCVCKSGSVFRLGRTWKVKRSAVHPCPCAFRERTSGTRWFKGLIVPKTVWMAWRWENPQPPPLRWISRAFQTTAGDSRRTEPDEVTQQYVSGLYASTFTRYAVICIRSWS